MVHLHFFNWHLRLSFSVHPSLNSTPICPIVPTTIDQLGGTPFNSSHSSRCSAHKQQPIQCIWSTSHPPTRRDLLVVAAAALVVDVVVGLLFWSPQSVVSWQPIPILLRLLQHDQRRPDHSPGWYRIDFGFSSQTAKWTRRREEDDSIDSIRTKRASEY